MTVGAIPLGLAAGAIVYLIVYKAVLAYREGRRQRFAGRRPAGELRRPNSGLRTCAAAALRLGVNIDHVATVRNARGGSEPDPVRAALDRREGRRRRHHRASARGPPPYHRRRHHAGSMDGLALPLNLEMAATDEMLAIALRHRPHAACIVPERREERTTEGGLDAAGGHNHLQRFVTELGEARIRVSLFVEAGPRQLDAASTARRAGRGASYRRLLRGGDRRRNTPEARASPEAAQGARATARRSGSRSMPATA